MESQLTDEQGNERAAREDWLAREVAATPAALPWMVFQKLEVFEHYLGFNGDSSDDWSDKRLTVLFAGIKADLLRFGVGKE